MTKNSYPVRVSDDGEAAIRRETDPRYPHLGPWHSTSGASLSDVQVEDWAPYIKFEEPGAAVFADALNEWAAHWPPKIGDDVELESIYAPLHELSPEQLEQLAVVASSLSSRCWEVRGPKLVEEFRAAQGTTWAYVNVDADGALLSGDVISIVTVGNDAAPVPERVERGGVVAGPRLTQALRTIGYRPVDLTDGRLDDGVLAFLVRKVATGE